MAKLMAAIAAWATGLGGVGLMVIAILDSSFLSFPQVNDVLLIVLSTKYPDRMVYYAAMTTVGSIVGCFMLFAVARRDEPDEQPPRRRQRRLHGRLGSLQQEHHRP